MTNLKSKFGKFVNQKGSALMEVLISIFIITMGLTGSAMLIIKAIHINSINSDRIIAINLAREGVEAVRNIRDTNWLTWSANIRECWNFLNDTDEDGIIDDDDLACSANADEQNDSPIGINGDGDFVTNYIVDFNEDNFRWVLIDAGNLPDDYSTILHRNSDNLYTHKSQVPNEETKFSREITIKYIDNIDNTVSPPTYYFPEGDKGKDNRILIESRVSWFSRGRNQEVVLAQTLTDYLGRDNWND